MHILKSERTHLDPKLKNYCGPKTVIFHVKRYLSKNDQNKTKNDKKLLGHAHYRCQSKNLFSSFQKGHWGMSGSIYHPNLPPSQKKNYFSKNGPKIASGHFHQRVDESPKYFSFSRMVRLKITFRSINNYNVKIAPCSLLDLRHI